MTTLWDELNLDRWTWELPRSTPGPYVAEHIPKPLITDWVKKWKPIINDALEKAEKYDEIQDCVPFVQHLAFEQVVKEYKTMQDKLEAIKNHAEAFESPFLGMCEDCPYPDEIKTREENCGRCAAGSFKFWMEDFKKILGDQTSTETT